MSSRSGIPLLAPLRLLRVYVLRPLGTVAPRSLAAFSMQRASFCVGHAGCPRRTSARLHGAGDGKDQVRGVRTRIVRACCYIVANQAPANCEMKQGLYRAAPASELAEVPGSLQEATTGLKPSKPETSFHPTPSRKRRLVGGRRDF